MLLLFGYYALHFNLILFGYEYRLLLFPPRQVWKNQLDISLWGEIFIKRLSKKTHHYAKQ